MPLSVLRASLFVKTALYVVVEALMRLPSSTCLSSISHETVGVGVPEIGTSRWKRVPARTVITSRNCDPRSIFGASEIEILKEKKIKSS